MSTLRALPGNSELVVLDDGSIDSSLTWLKSVKDARLRVIENKSPSGVAAGLNCLLRETESRYVARMDADDVCLPWRFAIQMNRIQHVDFSFTSVEFINRYGMPIRPDAPGAIHPSSMPLHLLLGNVLVHPTMVARRDAITGLGGYFETAAEDYDLWLRAAAAGLRLEKSVIPTLLYRKHSNQVTKTGGWLERSRGKQLDASFAALLRQQLGDNFRDPKELRWQRTSGARLSGGSEDKITFAKSMRDASARLGPVQRSLLISRLLRVDGRP